MDLKYPWSCIIAPSLPRPPKTRTRPIHCWSSSGLMWPSTYRKRRGDATETRRLVHAGLQRKSASRDPVAGSAPDSTQPGYETVAKFTARLGMPSPTAGSTSSHSTFVVLTRGIQPAGGCPRCSACPSTPACTRVAWHLSRWPTEAYGRCG